MKDRSNRIEELASDLKFHKKLYYAGVPEISDENFDALERALRKVSPDHPVLSLVGSITTSKGKVKHDQKMLSLDKKYDVNELKSWMGNNNTVMLFKADGVSCSLIYENGKLIQAKTRGNGLQGEDITDKVMWIESVPKQITIPDTCVEIRGEIVCTKINFQELSNIMISKGLDKPTSPRNIVAGLLNRKEHLELCSSLNFLSFDIITNETLFAWEWSKLEELEHLKFKVPYHVEVSDLLQIEPQLNFVQEFIEKGDYGIDGAVFVYNDTNLHKELGETSHHPRYKMAFKFAGKSKITTLNSITWQVSRQGILTPVGEVDPIELSDAIITRVTLHNYGNVVENQLKAGDQIEIIRSGEVIPKFLCVQEPSEEDFIVPSICPCCGTPLKVEGNIRLVCKNFDCPAQIANTILYFIQNIGIDDLSSKRLGDLIDKNIIKTIPDLYKLTEEQLVTSNRVGKALALKLITNIHNSKNPDLVTFIKALGLKGGARSKCEKLIKAGYTSLMDLIELEIKDVQKVESFAKKSATDFVTSLRSKIDLINELMTLGVKIKEVEIKENNGILANKKLCITGTLSKPRKEIQTLIKNHGGESMSSVTSKTDFLIINDLESGSSKAVNARKHGTVLLSEKQLYEMLGV